MAEERQAVDENAADLEDMDRAQKVRHKILDALVDGAISSKDPDQLNAVFKAVDGMDKSAVSKMKLREKKKENENSANETEALSKFLVHLAENRAGNQPPPANPGAKPREELPADRRPNYDRSLADPKASTENSEEFSARMESQGTKLPQD